jgi:hypothetical protein
MTENTASMEKPMSKQEIEEKLDKTQVEMNVYQAAVLNKLLTGTSFRFDSFESAKKKVGTAGKNTKK